MYRIKSNLPVSGIHWGLEFASGVAETDNRPLAEKLAQRGYTVQELAETAEEPKPNPKPKRKKEG